MSKAAVPANTVVPPSGPAGASSAGASGAGGVESDAAGALNPSRGVPDVAATIAAFVGEGMGEVAPGGSVLPGEKGSGTAPAVRGAEDEERGETDVEAAEAAGGAEAGDDDPGAEAAAGAEAGGSGKGAGEGQLHHLVEALLADPENAGLRGRVTRLLGEPAELKRQLRELEERYKDVEGPPVVAGPATMADPLAQVVTAGQLEEAVRVAQAWEDWCEENREGGRPDPRDEKSELSAEEVGERLRQARAILRAAPGRRQYLEGVAASRERLRGSHPDLFERDSVLAGEVTRLLREGRIGAGHPEYMQDAVDLLEGRRARLERERGIQTVRIDPKKAAGAGAGAGAAPAVVKGAGGAGAGAGVTRVAPVRPAGSAAPMGEAIKRARGGDVKAQAAVIEAFVNS